MIGIGLMELLTRTIEECNMATISRYLVVSGGINMLISLYGIGLNHDLNIPYTNRIQDNCSIWLIITLIVLGEAIVGSVIIFKDYISLPCDDSDSDLRGYYKHALFMFTTVTIAVQWIWFLFAWTHFWTVFHLCLFHEIYNLSPSMAPKTIQNWGKIKKTASTVAVSYTHLRAHET